MTDLPLKVLLVVAILIASAAHANPGAEPAVVTFKKSSTEVAREELEKLAPVASALEQDPALDVFIEDYIGGLKPRQQAYLVARARALLIFQDLVNRGINPGRIRYVERSTDLSKGFVRVNLAPTDAADPASRLIPTRTAQAVKDGENISEFRFLFASASAAHLPVDDTVLGQFLSSVGQPGKDAVLIEGYTDTKGNAVYNKFLSELRALHVFELLVRSGLPPYRFVARGMGVDEGTGQGTEEEQAARRRVVVKWIEDANVAAVAQSKEKPKEEPKPEPEPTPEPTREPEPEEPQRWSTWVSGGQIAPSGALAKHTDGALQFGLGVARVFYQGLVTDARFAVITTSKSKHGPREDDRAGTLELQFLRIRSDLRWNTPAIKPFIGFGMDLLSWSGTITEPSSARSNSGKNNDTGAELVIGLDIPAFSALTFAPEIGLHTFGGDFGETVHSFMGVFKWDL